MGNWEVPGAELVGKVRCCEDAGKWRAALRLRDFVFGIRFVEIPGRTDGKGRWALDAAYVPGNMLSLSVNGSWLVRMPGETMERDALPALVASDEGLEKAKEGADGMIPEFLVLLKHEAFFALEGIAEPLKVCTRRDDDAILRRDMRLYLNEDGTPTEETLRHIRGS